MAESKVQNFNHLKIHSQYSICEGAVKIDDLKEISKNNKIRSLGWSNKFTSKQAILRSINEVIADANC